MPTYEYRCLDCQHQYEKREGFDAPALQECPMCGGTARRVLQATPVLFKGSGFYVTDSRKPESGGTEGPSPETAGSAPESDAAAKVQPAEGSPKESSKDGEAPPKADKAAAAS